MPPEDGASALRVEVVYSPAAGQVEEVSLMLEAGATLAQAVQASGLLQRHPVLQSDVLSHGVWGRLQPADTALRDGDRVELYRPLIVDPKEARRLRHRKQRGSAAR